MVIICQVLKKLHVYTGMCKEIDVPCNTVVQIYKKQGTQGIRILMDCNINQVLMDRTKVLNIRTVSSLKCCGSLIRVINDFLQGF